MQNAMRVVRAAAVGVVLLLVSALLLPARQVASRPTQQHAAAPPPAAPLDAAELSRRRQKPVVIVLGTAGSGTRTVHQILAAAGVWMHPYTNKEFDSKLFIKKIKHTPPFGMPKWKTGMMWETRHSPAHYHPQQLSEDVRRKLEHAHQQVAAEFLADVPPDAAVWGWKEPQAIYTLPFLVKVFPNLHIIHQTRDGRDVAMSNLNSTSRRMTQPYQRHYVKLISGQDFTDSELYTPRFSVAAGHTWAAVNANARRWALAAQGLGLQGRYSLTRLEDFCDGDTLHDTVATLLEHAGVSVNASVVAAAAATINFTKCQTDRWEAAWDSKDVQLSTAMRQLDADIADSLELFDYAPKTTPGWLENSELRARLLQLQPVKAAAAAAAAAHGSTQQPQQQQPPLLLAFAQPHEHQAVSSWLESVKEATGGAATLERVVIVWQQQEQQRQHQQQQKPDTEGSAAAAAGAGTAALPEVEAAGLSLLEFTSSVAAAQHPDWSSGQNSSSSSSHNRELLVQQLHVLAELHRMHLPVLLCDIHSHWLGDAAQHIQQQAAAASGQQQQQQLSVASSTSSRGSAGCCDLVVSASVLPVKNVLGVRGTPAGSNSSSLQQQLKAAAAAAAADGGRGGGAAIGGVAFFNATTQAGAVLRALLRQQYHPHQQHLSQHVRNGSDAHGPRNKSTHLQAVPASLMAALQHQLLMANLKFSDPMASIHSSSSSSSSSSSAGATARNTSPSSPPPPAVLGVKATTAPHPLRVLLLPAERLTQPCAHRQRPGQAGSDSSGASAAAGASVGSDDSVAVAGGSGGAIVCDGSSRDASHGAQLADSQV